MTANKYSPVTLGIGLTNFDNNDKKFLENKFMKNPAIP